MVRVWIELGVGWGGVMSHKILQRRKSFKTKKKNVIKIQYSNLYNVGYFLQLQLSCIFKFWKINVYTMSIQPFDLLTGLCWPLPDKTSTIPD
jgi:hypothetical protein